MKKFAQALQDPYESSGSNFAYKEFCKKQIRYLKEESIIKSNIIQSLNDGRKCKILINNANNNPHSNCNNKNFINNSVINFFYNNTNATTNNNTNFNTKIINNSNVNFTLMLTLRNSTGNIFNNNLDVINKSNNEINSATNIINDNKNNSSDRCNNNQDSRHRYQHRPVITIRPSLSVRPFVRLLHFLCIL